jgi:hypothetical protein
MCTFKMNIKTDMDCDTDMDIVKIIEICVSDLAQNLNVDPDTDLQPGCQWNPNLDPGLFIVHGETCSLLH